MKRVDKSVPVPLPKSGVPNTILPGETFVAREPGDRTSRLELSPRWIVLAETGEVLGALRERDEIRALYFARLSYPRAAVGLRVVGWREATDAERAIARRVAPWYPRHKRKKHEANDRDMALRAVAGKST
jgi:hypothetical protein